MENLVEKGIKKNEVNHINFINQYLETIKKAGVDESQVSDGYHTFAELYEFRKMYNAALFNEWAKQGKYDVHKSWYHNDGEPCFGKLNKWFIVVAVLPTGQISNHYKLADWDLFQIPETSKAKYAFDGHTPKNVLDRLKSVLHTDKFLSHCNEFVNQQLGGHIFDGAISKINSIELFLSAHPDCEENSECADRLEDAKDLKLTLDKIFEAVKHPKASVSERMEMVKKILDIQ